MQSLTVTTETARAAARRYVAELEQRGYTAAKADAEVHMGKAAPCEPGYTISHGWISVPAIAPAGRWRFAELSQENAYVARQGDLFGG